MKLQFVLNALIVAQVVLALARVLIVVVLLVAVFVVSVLCGVQKFW